MLNNLIITVVIFTWFSKRRWSGNLIHVPSPLLKSYVLMESFGSAASN